MKRPQTYKVGTPPLGADPALTQWLVRELERIGEHVASGGVSMLTFDVMHELPARPLAGNVQFFAGNVVGPGQPVGLYEYRDLTGWTKL